jgi:hypothetical protein
VYLQQLFLGSPALPQIKSPTFAKPSAGKLTTFALQKITFLLQGKLSTLDKAFKRLKA